MSFKYIESFMNSCSFSMFDYEDMFNFEDIVHDPELIHKLLIDKIKNL